MRKKQKVSHMSSLAEEQHARAQWFIRKKDMMTLSIIASLCFASTPTVFLIGALMLMQANHEFVIPRQRTEMESVVTQLGADRFRRAYRMTPQQFKHLVDLLEPHLSLGKGKGAHGPNTLIPLPLRVSAAIRYLAGGDPIDIALSHGVAPSYVFPGLIWPVIEAINHCPDLDICFPVKHIDQRQIARKFKEKSHAGFDCCVGAIDGLLIWTEKPTERDCRMFGNIQSGSFFCGRKHKFGFNMQAICDSDCRFLEFWIANPASASDYISYVTSDFYNKKLQMPHFLAKGLVLFGDNAYVSNEFMATPYKSARRGTKDDYNFFHSQLRIRIEMAFGMLTSRWGILRKALPANLGILKQIAVTGACVRLHNFCLDSKNADDANVLNEDFGKSHENEIVPLPPQDEIYVQTSGGLIYGPNGEPQSLLHAGEHFDDVPDCVAHLSTRAEVRNKMKEQVRELGLVRPLPRKRMLHSI